MAIPQITGYKLNRIKYRTQIQSIFCFMCQVKGYWQRRFQLTLCPYEVMVVVHGIIDDRCWKSTKCVHRYNVYTFAHVGQVLFNWLDVILVIIIFLIIFNWMWSTHSGSWILWTFFAFDKLTPIWRGGNEFTWFGFLFLFDMRGSHDAVVLSTWNKSISQR